MTIFMFIYILMISFVKFCVSSEECEDGFRNVLFEIKSSRPEISFSSSNTIFVVSSNYAEPKTLDDFESISKLLGFRVIRFPEFCPDAFKAMKIASERIRNVFSLNVSLPAHYLDGATKIHHNLIIKNTWGEDTQECNSYEVENSPNNCKKVCKFDTKLYSSVENVETYDKCNITYERENVFAAIMSKTLQKYKLFVDFLKDFNQSYRIEEYAYMEKFKRASRILEPKGPIEGETILVCADVKNKWHKQFSIDNVRFAVNCRSIESFPQQILVAVLAPKPFYDEDKTYVPTIFYNTPYLLPEHIDAYPHGIAMFDDYNGRMTRGIMTFIEAMGWNRIAIVSDDSKYSEDFEAELVKMFTEKEVIHVVEQCQGRVCEFNEALKSLKEKQARIIIANVDEKYAKDLVAAAVEHGLTSYNDVMWIWRDWPFKNYAETQVLGEVFSISLASQKYEDQHQNTNLGNILNGIKFIKETAHVKNKWLGLPKITDEKTNHDLEKMHYRKILKTISSSDAWVLLKSIKADVPNVVFTFEFGDKYNKIKMDKNVIRYKDLPSDCFHRSYSYSSPCLDAYPLIIMGVICFVLLILLGIVYFMHMYVNNQIRYRPFHE